MQITAMNTIIVRTEKKRPWCFVEIETDSGEIGVGEASQSRGDRGVAEQVRLMEAELLGRDPADMITPSAERLLRDPFSGRLKYAAVSAVDQALWDLVGKQAGMPCHRLFGGALRKEIPLYANLALAAPELDAEAMGEAAAAAVSEGFRAVKIYPMGGFGANPQGIGEGAGTNRSGHGPDKPSEAKHDRGSRWEGARRMIAVVRQSVGDEVEIMTDWAWNVVPADASRLAEIALEFDLYWVEEPFATAGIRGMGRLRDRLPCRVAGGEQLSGREAARDIVSAEAVDVYMPDVKWIGGISEARYACAMAEAYGMEISPHNMSGPVATAASACVAASFASATWLEFCWGNTPWRSELVSNTERVSDGRLILSDAPGLGIDWNPEAAREYAEAVL